MSTLPLNVYDRILNPRPLIDVNSQDWNRLLFYAGRPLQSAELNEVQTLLINIINGLGRTLFNEGSIVSGIEIIQKAGDLVQVTGGIMFIDGRARQIPGTPGDLTLTGTGREFVSIVRTRSITGPETDQSLLDPALAPAIAAPQFNLKGALRETFTYQYVVVNLGNPNPNAVPIFEFLDGNLITPQVQGQFTSILRTLARRTYDHDGHFLVNGFFIGVISDPSDSTKLLIRIDPGKAYVQGFEILKTVTSFFSVPKALTDQEVNGESIVFTTTPSPIRIYPLASTPVEKVPLVAAKVPRTLAAGSRLAVVRSSTDSFDNLFSDTDVAPPIGPDSIQKGIAIFQLLVVSNTSGGSADYVQGVDYVLSGNTISWISGTKPANGATYYIDLILIRQMNQGRRVRLSIVNEAIVHTAPGSTENLAHKDIIHVSRVAAGIPSTSATFIEGVDYHVHTGRSATVAPILGSISWAGAATQPGTGLTYYVSYDYWDHPIGFEGDYVSVDSYFDIDDVTPAGQLLVQFKYDNWDTNIENSVDFRVTGGDVPVDGSDMSIQYFFYLPRNDAISLGSNGQFVLHQGAPSINPELPSVSVSTLEIARILVPANSSNVLITYPETRRLTVQDILQLRDLLETQIYNAAIDDLESLALFENTSTSKKMVLVDPFIDFSRADFLYTGAVPFKCSVDPENGFLQLPQLYGGRVLSVLSELHATLFRNTVMASFTEALLLSQQFATESFILNPTRNLGPISSIRVNPKEWFWPDVVTTPDLRLDERVDVLFPVTQNDTKVESSRLTRIFGFVRKSFNRFWVGGSKIIPWAGAGTLSRTIYAPSSVIPSYPSNEIVGSEAMDRVDDRVIDRSATPVMDQITLTVSSSDWPPSADNISVYFDGVLMTIHPSQPQFQGSTPGTLQSDAAGTWSGFFTTPVRSRTGLKQIVASSLVPTQPGVTVQATTMFSSQGARNLRTASYVSLGVVDSTEVPGVDILSPIVRSEPVAQVFTSNFDSAITGVALYFSNRPTPLGVGDAPIYVQIRDIDQSGQPTSNVLAHAILNSSDVIPSLDGSTPTVVHFEDPVFIESGGSYALVLTTQTNLYAVFLSRLGSADLVTSQLVIQNPNVGTLWTSVGGQFYTQDASASLKFSILYASFDPLVKTTVVFNNITNLSSGQVLRDVNDNTNVPAVPNDLGLLPNKYTKFIHIVEQYIPTGARILWSYSTNGGVNWTQYTPGVEVKLGGVKSQLQIKCDMDMQQITGTSGGALTALSAAVSLALNGIALIGEENQGFYVTYNTNLATNATNLIVVVITDQALANASPSSRLKMYYSVNGGTSWISLDSTGSPSEQSLGSPWFERRYTLTGISAFNKLRIRIDLFNADAFGADPVAKAMRVIAS